MVRAFFIFSVVKFFQKVLLMRVYIVWLLIFRSLTTLESKKRSKTRVYALGEVTDNLHLKSSWNHEINWNCRIIKLWIKFFEITYLKSFKITKSRNLSKKYSLILLLVVLIYCLFKSLNKRKKHYDSITGKQKISNNRLELIDILSIVFRIGTSKTLNQN